MMKTLNEMVYGHTQAKKVLSVLLRRSQTRYYKKCVLGEEDYPQSLKCLLIGQSGTGKTHLINSLKKLHSFPLITLDGTQLMPAGNTDGMNVKQLTKLIKDTASKCVKQAEYHSEEGVLNQMVIFVDEFDKLGNCFESSGNWNQHVQANFLTLIDNKEEFEGISWIFAGAFSGIYKNKSNKTQQIGFFKEQTERTETNITDQDILRSGIIPELLGRISLIVELDTFTEHDYKHVLIERLLPKYPALSLEHTEIDNIVQKAYKSEQGIRHLTRQLEMLAVEAEYESLNECFSPKNSV